MAADEEIILEIAPGEDVLQGVGARSLPVPHFWGPRAREVEPHGSLLCRRHAISRREAKLNAIVALTSRRSALSFPPHGGSTGSRQLLTNLKKNAPSRACAQCKAG